MSDAPPFGIIAVFTTPAAILNAARHLRDGGFRAVDAYTPYLVEGLDEAIRPPPRPLLPLVMFAGAAIGAIYGFFLQYWDEVLGYPINVGGRPHDSWPAFVVSAFEITLLFAVAFGFFPLLAACRLPRLYHPLFSMPAFDRASRDRFVLCVEASDSSFEPDTLRQLLERLGAEEVAEVPA
jgi:hypothetical protein